MNVDFITHIICKNLMEKFILKSLTFYGTVWDIVDCFSSLKL